MAALPRPIDPQYDSKIPAFQFEELCTALGGSEEPGVRGPSALMAQQVILEPEVGARRLIATNYNRWVFWCMACPDGWPAACMRGLAF